MNGPPVPSSRRCSRCTAWAELAFVNPALPTEQILKSPPDALSAFFELLTLLTRFERAGVLCHGPWVTCLGSPWLPSRPRKPELRPAGPSAATPTSVFLCGSASECCCLYCRLCYSGPPLPPLTSLIASRVPLLLHGERSQVWFKFLQTSPSRPVGLHQPTQQKCLGNILKIPVTGPLPQMRVGLLWGGVQGSESSVGDSGAGDLHQELRHCCVLGPPGAH